MAIVRGKQARWRIFAAHALLWAFLAITLFPLLAVVSISLRPGNFATGSLIPSTISLEHWQLALGIPYQAADGSLVQPMTMRAERPIRSRSARSAALWR